MTYIVTASPAYGFEEVACRWWDGDVQIASSALHAFGDLPAGWTLIGEPA